MYFREGAFFKPVFLHLMINNIRNLEKKKYTAMDREPGNKTESNTKKQKKSQKMVPVEK